MSQNNVLRYKVRKVSSLPLAKFGCLLGGLGMVLPGLGCAAGSVTVIAALRALLDTWQTAQMDLLGGLAPLEFNFIKLLGLETAQTVLIQLDDQRLILALLLVLVCIFGGGLLAAITILLLGWGYNVLAALTGGLEVELQE
jgi:hypothetical protein